MDISTLDPRTRDVAHRVSSVSFGILTDAAVRELSVLRLTSAVSFDQLGRPVRGGLFDPRLGPTSHSAGSCATCGLPYATCPGHFAHIELAVPLVNPLLTPQLMLALSSKCWYCHSFRSAPRRAAMALARLYYLDAGDEASALACEALEVTAAPDKDEPGDAGEGGGVGGGGGGSSGKVDVDVSTVEASRLLAGARPAWEAAAAAGTLVPRGLAWKAAVRAFFSATGGRACRRCGGATIRVRRDGDAKIFRVALSGAAARVSAARGHALASAAASAVGVAARAATAAAAAPGGADGSGDAEGGSPSASAAAAAAAAAAVAAAATLDEGEARQTRLLSPLELEAQVVALWAAERDACELIWGCPGRPGRSSEGRDVASGEGARHGGGGTPHTPSLFFIRALAVPPARFRPANKTDSASYAAEHPQNVYYIKLLTGNAALLEAAAAAAAVAKAEAEATAAAERERDEAVTDTDGGDSDGSGGGGGGGVSRPADVDPVAAKKAAAAAAKAAKAATPAAAAKVILELQTALNSLIDSSRMGRSPSGQIQQNPTGLKQQLEHKEGLFRMYMMGKRVNHSARSVIGPDVFLDTNELGIPESFARRLTYPTPVSALTLAELRAAVRRGPAAHPGANAVEDPARGSQVVLLDVARRRNREAQAATLDRVGPGAVAAHRGGGMGGASSDAAACGEAAGSSSAGAGGDGGGAPPSAAAERAALMRQLPKRVYRHLKTGDLVLFNRQPSLHRASIMAHRVRVLPGERTLRMHYANCGAYNADFDGDEMNVHFPQDEVSRAEASTIAFTDNQYITPTSAKPLRGLIQDHVVAGVLLTQRNAFFTPAAFQQLLYGAAERLLTASPDTLVQLPVPAILKPDRLYTGKQLFTALLDVVRAGRPRIRVLAGAAQTSAKTVGPDEAVVLLRDGELLRGVLDKAAFGAARYGLVHAVQEAYGCDAAGALLSALGRLFTLLLRTHAHTTGVDDLLIADGAETTRVRCHARASATVGGEVVAKVAASLSTKVSAAEDGNGGGVGGGATTGASGGKSSTQRAGKSKNKAGKAAKGGSRTSRKRSRSGVRGEAAADAAAAAASAESRLLLESLVRTRGNVAEELMDAGMTGALHAVSTEVVETCLPAALIKPFPINGFQLMTATGAKGSVVNASQISCHLGQTVLEGRRVPRMGGGGATLPCFAPFDVTPRAGGYIAGRFLTGLAPSEYFFHCMAGREGLVDTAVKTARSGYLQRCLVKHLESARVHYDHTVRDSDASVLQFVYGEDGLDASKAAWLTRTVGWQVANHAALAADADPIEPSPAQRPMDPAIAVDAKATRRAARKAAKAAERGTPVPASAAATLSGTRLERLSPAAVSRFGATSETYETKVADYVASMTSRPAAHVSAAYGGEGDGNGGGEGILTVRPSSHKRRAARNAKKAGADAAVAAVAAPVIASSTASLATAAEVEAFMAWRYQRGLAEPGEAVGVVAAQGVGEPSTQMTLNTFHFAGMASAAVTQGIPRLRELLMTAARNPTTPTMTLPVLGRGEVGKATAEALALRLRRLGLADLLTAVEVRQGTTVDGVVSVVVRLCFPHPAVYEAPLRMSRADLVRSVANGFVPRLLTVVTREVRKLDSGSGVGGRVRVAAACGAGGVDDVLLPDSGRVTGTPVSQRRSRRSDVGGAVGGAANEDGNDVYDTADLEGADGLGDDAGPTGGAAPAAEDMDATEAKLVAEDEGQEYYDDADDDEGMGDGDEAGDDVFSIISGGSSDADGGGGGGGSGGGGASRAVSTGGMGVDSGKAISDEELANRGVTYDHSPARGWVDVGLTLPPSAPGRVAVADLATAVARAVDIRAVPGVTRTFVEEATGDGAAPDGWQVTTQGCNLTAAWRCADLVDVARIESNHIWAMIQAYGVEAGRAALVRDLNGVFASYGKVDPRHLGLIADYMTVDGGYRGFNRIAMQAAPSEFQKMSFETTTAFLTTAAINGTADAMTSPSASIVMGEVPLVGTGCFDLMQSF